MKKQFTTVWVLSLSFLLQAIGPAASASIPLAAEDTIPLEDTIELVDRNTVDVEIQELEKFQQERGKALTKEQKKELRRKKRQRLARNIGRFLGKVSTQAYTEVTRSFLKAGGFVRGFFEHPEKNQRSVALLKFILQAKNFDQLRATYKKAGTLDEYIVEFSQDLEKVIQVEMNSLIIEILRQSDPSVPADQDLSKLNLARVDFSKLDANQIRSLERFTLFDEAFGPFAVEEIVDDLKSGTLNPDLVDSIESMDELSDLIAHLPDWKELGAVFLGQHLATPIIISAISQTAGALYTWPLLATAGGTVVSALSCAKHHQRVAQAGLGESAYTSSEQFENDSDLRKFCSEVTNQSLFKMALSREKGYVAGKKLKAKFRKKFPKKTKNPTSSGLPDSNHSPEIIIEDEQNL